MNYFIKSILILCISLSLQGCSGNGVSEQSEQAYREILTLYPNDLVDHLPCIDNQKVKFIELEFPKGKYCSYIHLIIPYSQNKIDSVEARTRTIAKAEYHFTDSCSMIVNYNSVIYSNTSFKLKKCNLLSNMLPIPNFEFLKDADLPINFYKNASIYVLDAKRGEILDIDYLSREGVGLPNEWLHGYTKGVVIGGNITVYWLEVW